MSRDPVPPVGRRKLLSFLAGAAAAPGPALAQQGMRVSIGTTALAAGGGYSLYTSAFLDMMRSVDPLLDFRPVPTKGTVENAALLASGDIDLGLVSGEVTNELLSRAPTDAEKIKVVNVMYATPGMFAVRADSRFRSVMDLRGRPVAWGMKGSGVTVQARYVMEGLGLDMDRDFEPLYQEKWTDGPPLVLQGRAGALWGSGLRWPAFVELSNTPMGARFIVPNALEIQRICTKFAFLSRLSVPAGLYVGQYDRLDTVGTWSFILARPGLSDAVGFRIVSAIDRAQRTGALTKQLVQTTVKNTLSAISSPEALQGGVAEYYRKHGFLK